MYGRTALLVVPNCRQAQVQAGVAPSSSGSYLNHSRPVVVAAAPAWYLRDRLPAKITLLIPHSSSDNASHHLPATVFPISPQTAQNHPFERRRIAGPAMTPMEAAPVSRPRPLQSSRVATSRSTTRPAFDPPPSLVSRQPLSRRPTSPNTHAKHFLATILFFHEPESQSVPNPLHHP